MPVAKQVASIIATILDRKRTLDDPRLKLVVDCSALISTYAKAYAERIKPNSVNAGYWAQIGDRLLESSEIANVQAHKTIQQSTAHR